MSRGYASLQHRNKALTRRQREVLEAVLDNLTNKEIGERLSISERAVKFHFRAFLRNSKHGAGQNSS